MCTALAFYIETTENIKLRYLTALLQNVWVQRGLNDRFLTFSWRILNHWINAYNWAASRQNQQNDLCAQRRLRSDQPGHPHSLIRVFAFRTKNAWVLSYQLSAQRRLWSVWANAQADLSLRWAHSHFAGFVMRRLNYNDDDLQHELINAYCRQISLLWIFLLISFNWAEFLFKRASKHSVFTINTCEPVC